MGKGARKPGPLFRPASHLLTTLIQGNMNGNKASLRDTIKKLVRIVYYTYSMYRENLLSIANGVDIY